MNLAKVLKKYQMGGEITAKRVMPEKIQPFSSWNIGQWGLNDYSKFQGDESQGISSFNSAFRRARGDGEKKFVWKGKKYSTNLISKKSEKNYKDSETFLKDYVKSDYYKQKIAPLNGVDSMNVADLYIKPDNINATTEEDFIKQLESMEKNIPKSSYEKYRNFKYQKNQRDILADFDKPVDYFSITEQPKPGNVTGTVTTKKGSKNPVYRKYIEMNPNNPNGDYTAAHELAHEMFSYNKDKNLSNNTDIEFETALPYMSGKGDLSYVNDENEHAARIMATRKYAFDKYKIGHRDITDNEANLLYKDLKANKLGDSYYINLVVKTPKELKEYLNNPPIEPKLQESEKYKRFQEKGDYMEFMNNTEEDFYKKYQQGGIMKNYSFGGDLFKYGLNTMENAAYQFTGLDMLGLDLYKPKFESDTMKQVDKTTQSVMSIGTKLKPIAANIAGSMAGMPGIGTTVQQTGNQIGKQISQFKKGGIMGNYQGGIMPQNPNDLQAVTENTMEFNGNSHKSGGIPLNNGAELEKDETVIKQGAIGNKDPYAISPNLVLDRETAKLVGLPSKYVGMKLSDISRKIEDMKAAKENDAMSEKTNSMNKKFALNSLIKANELLSAQHRQKQGVNEMSDLRQEEMQLGGKMPEDFMQYYTNTTDYTLNPEAEETWLKNNPDGWKDYMKDYNDWKGNSFATSPVNITASRLANTSNKLGTTLQPNIGTSILNNSTNLNVQNLDIPKFDLPSPQSKSFDLKSNLGNIGMGLKGASLLANFATIGKKPGQIPAQFNPYATDILNNYRNSIDNQAIKNDVTSVLNTGLNANPSRNWNVQRAINSDLVGRSMDAMSKANLQNQEINNRYRSELGNVQNNLGQQNVQAKNMAEVLNAQTQANWRNNLRQGIGNVGNDVADMLIQKQFVQDATKDGMALTKEKIKILQNKWGSSFGADSDKFMDMLQAVFPSYTKEQLTKIASE